MKKKFREVSWQAMAAGIIILCVAALAAGKINAGVASTLIAVMALLVMILWSRQSLAAVKLLSMMAALIALAALGRIPFAALPGVQPSSFLIIVSGLVFGPQAGFLTGAMTALVSNFFLGQGPWTPWQMLGWGLMGMSAAGLMHMKGPRLPVVLALLAGVWGYLFGWIQNIGFVTVFITPATFKAYLASCAVSFTFDSIHAATNFLLCLFLSSPVIKILQSFRRRLEIDYLSSPPDSGASDMGFSSAEKRDKDGS